MSLLGKILQELFGGIPARFTSAYSLEESVERLRSATKRSPFRGLFKEAAVGKVSEQKVSLQRVVPFFGNSFKPIFKGGFEREANGIVLEGQFTKFLVTKVFSAFWFGFGTLWTLLSCFFSLGTALMPSETPTLYVTIFFPLIGIGMLAAGYLLERMAWQWSRGDIEYLSAVISQALDGQRLPSGEP